MPHHGLRVGVLGRINLTEWTQLAEQGTLAGRVGPYGLEHLEALGHEVFWPRILRSGSPHERALRKVLRPWDRRVAWSGAFRALTSLNAVRDADVLLSFFEDEGTFAAQMKARRVPLFRNVPHVLVICWLVDRIPQLSAREITSLGRGLRAAEALVVMSANQVDPLVSVFDLDRSRVHVIDFGISTQFFSPQQRPASFDLLAVGRDKARDYATLIAAVSGSAWRTHIVCAPTNVQSLDVPDNVTVEFAADHVRYRELLASARVVVTPTTAPAYPSGQTVLLEAMSMGRATVMTSSPAISDYVDPSTTVLVPSGDPAALRAALAALLNDEEAMSRLGQEGRRRVLRQNDHAQMWQAFAQVLTDVASKRPRG